MAGLFRNLSVTEILASRPIPDILNFTNCKKNSLHQADWHLLHLHLLPLLLLLVLVVILLEVVVYCVGGADTK